MFKKKDIKKLTSEESKQIDYSREVLPSTLELSKISQQIYKASREIDESSSRLATVSKTVNESLGTSKQYMHKVEEEIQSISVRAESIYEDAVENNKLSEANITSVNKNQIYLEESMHKLEDLVYYYNHSFEILEEFQRYSERIHYITEYMKQIANKTKILSINASIEAARAGEAGRGFSVITEEIKNLANQSESFSEEINQMVIGITGCIGKMDEATKMNNEKIINIKETVLIMKDSLDNIVESSTALDTNIQSTLKESKLIDDSIKIGKQQVEVLSDAFNKNSQDVDKMMQVISQQMYCIKEVGNINNGIKDLSEKQLDKIFSTDLEEKLKVIGRQIGCYKGNTDVSSLQRLADKFGVEGIYYANSQGTFIAGNSEDSIGVNIFEIDPSYKCFVDSNEREKVFPLSRNYNTGEIIRFMAVKAESTNQLLSIGFDLDGLIKINSTKIEELQKVPS